MIYLGSDISEVRRMGFLKEIVNETLIICTNNLKLSILKLNRLMPVKFMDWNEFIRKFYFDYDERAILYLSKKMQVKFEVAKMYLDNLYYILDKNYDNKKLSLLVEIKNDLDSKGLLKYNSDFKNYLQEVDIIVYDHHLNIFEEKMLTGLNYRVIPRERKKYEHDVLEFNTMEEEVSYVAYQICTLIDKGIDVKNIKLANVGKDYYGVIERIFSLFNLRVNIPYASKLSSYPEVEKFINNYQECSLEDAICGLDDKSFIYDELVKVINKYRIYQDKELILYMLENTYIKSSGYTSGIDIIDYLDYVASDLEYVFLVGFNDGVVPNSYKDTEYITDNIRKTVGLFNLEKLNAFLREDIINNLSDIKNLTITYKLRDDKKTYFPSTLCSNFNIKKDPVKYLYSYSEGYNKIKLMDAYDNYLKFGKMSEEFAVLNNNFKINYHGYDNKYKKINRVSEDILLSYSSMQLYNKCAFRYYLAKILKLDIFEDNFSAFLGSMVHFVMEECLKNNDNEIDKYIQEYSQERVFTKKEQFFLEKYKIVVKDLLNHVLEERKYGLFDKEMYEKEIEISLDEKNKFVGIIDKIRYLEKDDKTYFALIDYKTGNEDINLKYLPYGLNMQLPIYLYLANYLNFNNPECVGFYLQKINVKEKDFRLVGYSNDCVDKLMIIDSDYDNSKIIKGLKTKKDGSFSGYAKLMSDEDMKKIVELTHEKIVATVKNIQDNNFEINPKVIDQKEIGCDFCKFKDICNVTKNDRVIITTEEGEIDG